MSADPTQIAEINANASAGPERLTDAGNARRFAAQHAGSFTFAPGLGWHEYDGKRWVQDNTGAVYRAAKETAKSIYAEAARADDEDARKAIAKHAMRSEGEPRLRAMLALSQSELELVHLPSEFDRDAFLLNCENGTLNLRTGRLRKHDPADLLTKLAPVAFTPDATDDMVDRVLWSLYADQPENAVELLKYLQRFAGYCLTGDTGAEKLLFVHGPEASGKGTFLGALAAVLGDYAATADFESFLARRGDGGVRNDIARLVGTRIVLSNEVDEGKRLAEGLIKTITGGDTITARKLYQESFEFKPQFKLVLAANARPRVSATDGAMWRRIDCVPFTHTIPEHERDPQVKEHLLSDPGARSALLAWALEGCKVWQKQGLATPAAVKDYTAGYREENDVLGEWIADCCELDKDATAKGAALNASYAEWTVARREPAMDGKALARELEKRGLTKKHGKSGAVWTGISVGRR